MDLGSTRSARVGTFHRDTATCVSPARDAQSLPPRRDAHRDHSIDAIDSESATHNGE